VRDRISTRAVVGATPSSASSAGCSPRGPRPIRRSASWDRPYSRARAVMSARPMSPDPARSPVHAHRVYQVDVLIGRACSVRPYVLCRRLTAPHRTPNRPPRLAPLGGCSRTGPLSILQHTLHVVCSHAHGYPAHASIICIGLLSHICLPWRRRFPRGAGLLAQWRRAHARATL
jgi:hypothetical protein